MKINNVWFDETNIYVVLDTGHTIGNPLSWFERPAKATPEQRNQYKKGPFGESLHWEAIDEDLSLESFFDFKRELNYTKI